MLRAMDRPFVINAADAPARSHPRRATLIDFEADEAPFPEVGVNIQVMQPGQPNCRYHSEPVQEDFLVLQGECIAIVDGEERRLRQWDFLHCPAGTDHVFVGAGAGPCAVLMIGSRSRDEAHYPVNELAARYGAGGGRGPHHPAPAHRRPGRGLRGLARRALARRRGSLAAGLTRRSSAAAADGGAEHDQRRR
jgi:uncharacterized cupin superfamily protein